MAWRAGAQRQAIELWPAVQSPASTGSSCAVGNGPSGVARECPLRRLGAAGPAFPMAAGSYNNIGGGLVTLRK
ncbi:hypothetical protein [Verminephrobacter eiseniae]|uniref:hypothetical protein n=1 Tax=Verminephrobacter eiseniae TaxID=364317 RepID=UPI002238F560|nr:hypothetical protein [Verminephrobacter eiseniae]MCW5236781.1 hypothetical protein [Verminephrobacter eiseniae]